MQLHPGIFGTRHSVFQDFKTGAPDLIFQMWLLPSTRRPNPSWVPGPERVHGPVRFRAGGGERRTGSECSQGPRFLCSGRSPPYQLIHVPFTFQFLSVCHEKGPCVKIPQASLLLFPFWRKAGQRYSFSVQSLWLLSYASYLAAVSEPGSGSSDALEDFINNICHGQLGGLTLVAAVGPVVQQCWLMWPFRECLCLACVDVCI
ncbi:uncharacterized protein [Physeter macrocephalus]|uniref:Uncharacterized protein isoform X1 n=1 Tax=Physeter macrocephalus TaxID=9755 RepID=A0A455B1M7_PHYMC|nr:uncharacterized protein LOC114485495 isoform X1 [Physeter catodon]|eukprot:XP_028342815.1 uncharacterized protein LOC114485495 isoform X1 [Physeter catodon]